MKNIDIAVTLYIEAEHYSGEIGSAIREVADQVCQQGTVHSELLRLSLATGWYVANAKSHSNKLIRDILIAVYEDAVY